MIEKSLKIWRKHFLLLTIGLILPFLTFSNPAHIAVTTIRHGIHTDFERVVFDVTKNAQYNIESIPQSDDLIITIKGTDTQASTPIIQLSPNANLVMGIVMKSPGVFQVSTLNSVKTKSFTIPGEPYRIVVDIYPKVIIASSSTITQKPTPKPVEKPLESSKPTPTTLESETVKPQIVDSVTHPVLHSFALKDSTFDFNTLYNLKQAALNWQTIGKIDQASDCWEQFLVKAKELKLSITGKDFSYNGKTSKLANRIHEQIFSFVVNNLYMILPVGLSIFLLAMWTIRRRTKQKLIEEPLEETVIPPTPRKKPKVENKIEPEDKPVTVEQKIVQKPPEPVVEPTVKEDIPAREEEAALDEFFNNSDEVSAQEKKVQRILELAGAEKTIAEIAEEMGIGEDEVRLVLDLQGDRVKSESFQKSETV
jgi:hypothetical protein